MRLINIRQKRNCKKQLINLTRRHRTSTIIVDKNFLYDLSKRMDTTVFTKTTSKLYVNCYLTEYSAEGKFIDYGSACFIEIPIGYILVSWSVLNYQPSKYSNMYFLKNIKQKKVNKLIEFLNFIKNYIYMSFTHFIRK